MPDATLPRAPRPAWRARFAEGLRDPSPRLQMGCWLALAALFIGVRWWVAAHLPTYLWTRDSGSYFSPAYDWIQGGRWATNPRRGPIYSFFLAKILRAGGSLATVAELQAILGVLTAGLTVAAARVWLGKAAFWPLVLCTFWYAWLGMPVELERLIRNETLLLFFATVAFGAWFFTLRTGGLGWSALSGLAAGLMQLLKGIFPMFPLLVWVTVAWEWRRNPRRAIKLAACFGLLWVLPLTASRVYNVASGTDREPQPEAGEMFYGRTVQWTYLDGGIAPEFKARIRPLVEAYIRRSRARHRYDNNEVVKRTVIPALKHLLLDERHEQPADVNRLCWLLGLEAVAHHPLGYLGQFLRDLWYIHFISVQRGVIFTPEDLRGSAKDARRYVATRTPPGDPRAARIFDLAASDAAIHAGAAHRSGLQHYARLARVISYLHLLSPVFLTSLLLPFLIRRTRARERLFWIGLALLWYYYLALLATVGRPLDRYFMPILPIGFWAIAKSAALAWQAWLLRTGEPD